MIVAVDTNCIVPGRVGGIERYTLNLVRALLEHATWMDHLVLLARPENHDLFSAFEGKRCRAFLVPRQASAWEAASADALRSHQRAKAKIIADSQADVVHFPGNTINPIDLPYPAVLNLHDLQHRHLPHHFDPVELQRRERWWIGSARRADAVVTSTQFVAADLVDSIGIATERIFVAHPPIDASFASIDVAAAERTCRMLRLARTFFLYPAARWPHKNHNRLIKAFLAAGLPEAQLVLTGFEARNPSPGEGRVRCLGRVADEQLRALYQAATALVFPSEFEASSLPIMEAMSSGCPVAASNIPGLAELVGDAGLLFDPQNEDEMAAAMQRLARDLALRAELSSRGRSRVAQFTIESFVAGIHRAYSHAIAMKRRGEAARAA